jgi:hypothetical protein
MKKLAFVIVLLLAGNLVFGQFSIGPKIGYNTSKLTTDISEIDSEMKNSFNFGVFVRLGRKIYVQPEVNWLTRGGVFKKPEIGDIKPINQEIEMNTIEIPVLLGFRLINLGVGNVRVMAGPSASIITDKTISTSDPDNFTNPIEDADLEDLIWGFNVGAGIDVMMFTLDVRYQLGLTEVITTAKDFNFNSKSNVFAVSLGWKIL